MTDGKHTRHFGLIGNPLGHSLSSAFFAEKFSREGIDADYTPYPIPDITEVGRIMEMLEGFNVTIPYKRSIFPYLDETDPEAREVGAVNCVKICGDGKRIGYNTDIIGIRTSLNGTGLKQGERALVLGTGGAAAAVVHVLRGMGIDPATVSRSEKRGDLTYAGLDAGMLEQYRLIVNATPVGMYPATEKPPIPYGGITADHILFDLVYNPRETLFLKEGMSRGAKVIDGMTMFTTQALASWKIWNL